MSKLSGKLNSGSVPTAQGVTSGGKKGPRQRTGLLGMRIPAQLCLSPDICANFYHAMLLLSLSVVVVPTAAYW